MYNVQYIPNNITPHNWRWIPNERVTLRTGSGEWQVGVFTSGNMPLFSGGWNAFAEDDNLKYKKSYTFTLVTDDLDYVIFNVEKN